MVLDRLHQLTYAGSLEALVGRVAGIDLRESGHPAPQGSLFLHQENVGAGLGCFDCSRQAGDAPAHYQQRMLDGQRLGLGHLALLGADHAHAQVVLGQSLGLLSVGWLAPSNLLPQVNPLNCPWSAGCRSKTHPS